ncbi:hypothetical protein P171DRAFT_494534 [Karstenula rhodostoma CBS 690.94]|uniref:Uncharacterized protein n=1 Tax=Karstenula rhodostoma CBS 690.94 TaxID=1392251 RepID=A0A9P4PK12_9PLEO|nr:hypothetical protein P171DRAFT_494534 [Karstenula rhodostoma CBS 690.94]
MPSCNAQWLHTARTRDKGYSMDVMRRSVRRLVAPFYPGSLSPPAFPSSHPRQAFNYPPSAARRPLDLKTPVPIRRRDATSLKYAVRQELALHQRPLTDQPADTRSTEMITAQDEPGSPLLSSQVLPSTPVSDSEPHPKSDGGIVSTEKTETEDKSGSSLVNGNTPVADTQPRALEIAWSQPVYRPCSEAYGSYREAFPTIKTTLEAAYGDELRYPHPTQYIPAYLVISRYPPPQVHSQPGIHETPEATVAEKSNTSVEREKISDVEPRIPPSIHALAMNRSHSASEENQVGYSTISLCRRGKGQVQARCLRQPYKKRIGLDR